VFGCKHRSSQTTPISEFRAPTNSSLENKNDPECNFHHYQSIPHFKITLDINVH
jgi:hypothetical protein